MVNDPARDRDFIIPTTVEQAEADGLDFGLGAMSFGRKTFAQYLANHLQMMRGLLGVGDHAEEMLKALERAAWEAWGMGRK